MTPPQTSSISLETLAYEAIHDSFKTYDLYMTTASELFKNKIITEAQYKKAKEPAYKLYSAIKATKDLVKAYSTVQGGDPAKNTAATRLLSGLAVLAEYRGEIQTLFETLKRR